MRVKPSAVYIIHNPEEDKAIFKGLDAELSRYSFLEIRSFSDGMLGTPAYNPDILASCIAVIYVATYTTQKSPEAMMALEYAQQRKIPVLPVIWQGKNEVLPLSLKKTVSLNRNSDDLIPVINTLIELIIESNQLGNGKNGAIMADTPNVIQLAKIPTLNNQCLILAKSNESEVRLQTAEQIAHLTANNHSILRDFVPCITCVISILCEAGERALNTNQLEMAQSRFYQARFISLIGASREVACAISFAARASLAFRLFLSTKEIGFLDSASGDIHEALRLAPINSNFVMLGDMIASYHLVPAA